MFRSGTDEIFEFLEVFGVGRRRTYQYLGLFSVLAVIYSIYFSSLLKGMAAAPEVVTLGELFGPLAKFCLLSAVPFAGLAYSDKTWSSSDAAPVCLAAWATVFVGFSIERGTHCPLSAAFPFVPLVLSALAAHAVGTLLFLLK